VSGCCEGGGAKVEKRRDLKAGQATVTDESTGETFDLAGCPLQDRRWRKRLRKFGVRIESGGSEQ